MNNIETVLDKDTIRKIVNNSPCHFMFILKKQHNGTYEYIDKSFVGSTFSEKTYKFLNNNDDIGKCVVCGKNCKFLNMKLGYSKTCSYNCNGTDRSKNSREIRNCIICGNKFEAYKKQQKTTCSSKCLLELNKDVNVNKKRVETLKRTCLEKYGVDSFSKTNEFGNLCKQTKLERYGNENYVNVNKARETCLKRFGTDSYTKTNKYKNDVKSTCLNKYGVDNFSKTKKFKFIHFLRAISKLSSITPNFSFDDYSGVDKQRYEFICNVCTNKFSDTLDNGNIPICRKCFPITRTGAQNEIRDYIKEICKNVSIIESSRNIISPYEIDLFIPSKKLAIEYNGLYWHSENGNKKDKNYHLNKTELCNKKGVNLIHIFEDDWINKNSIVKNKLKRLLSLNNKIYAKDCISRVIETNKCNEFLNKNHLQGIDKSDIKLGLFYKDKLVSVMTFGKYRYATGIKTIKENEYEMYRFCIGDNIVVGAGGKLFSYFIKNYNPVKVITYADRAWSNNSAFYEKIGFKFIKCTEPNYWYIKKHGNIRYHRLQFQKHKLSKINGFVFDNKLTEWQNMQLNGYDRIWDCGNLKYEWTK